MSSLPAGTGNSKGLNPGTRHGVKSTRDSRRLSPQMHMCAVTKEIAFEEFSHSGMSQEETDALYGRKRTV